MNKITFIFLIVFGFTILNIARAEAECNIVRFNNTGSLMNSIATNETSRTPQATEELLLFLSHNGECFGGCDECGLEWVTQCYVYYLVCGQGGGDTSICLDGSWKSMSGGGIYGGTSTSSGTWDVVCGITTTTTQPTTTTTVPATVIELSSFTATHKAGKVILQWSTESEIDNAGFNLYRSESASGQFIKINTSLIPAQGSSTQGASYELTDTIVQNRKTYYYKLEDIDMNGTSTMHGPVNATPRLIYGL